MNPTDTLKIITDSMDILDASGNITATVAHKTTVLLALGDGIGWTCFLYGFLGIILHWMMKLSDGATTSAKNNSVFIPVKWVMQNKIYLIITFLSGMLALFLVQQYWPPTTVAKSIIVGFCAGSFIYNLWSMINNPDTWNGLLTKFFPNKKP